MRLPSPKTSHRPPSGLYLPVSYSEDGQFFTWASRRKALRITSGGRRGASLGSHLFGGLAVLVITLAALRLWMASTYPAIAPTVRVPSTVGAGSSRSTPPAGRTSDDSTTPSAIPMPPPLPTRTLIIHARDYPLTPVVTGGDPATGALPVPPFRAVVQVDSPSVRTFSHPPSVPIIDPSRAPGR